MSSKENSPAEITYPDGSTRVISFDEFMNIKAIRVTDHAHNIILCYEYAYDDRGNVVSKKTGQGDYAYGYDSLSRLTEISRAGRCMERYTYDASGNRLNSSDADGWEYGSDNQLLRYGATTFAYDLRGNTVRMAGPGGVQSYAYDGADHLVEVRDGKGSMIARYGYDDQGRRIRKEAFNPPLAEPGEMTPPSLIEPVEMSAQCKSSTSEITNYVYSEDGLLIGEYNLEGNAITSWFHDPYSGIPAEPLFMVHKGRKYIFHNDHLGTPQKITDASGKVVWSATYDAFGNAEVDPDSTITNNLRFPGQYYDSETGLHYNIHRYYNPATGRYLSKDPLKVVAEGSNLYSYANANPLKYYDHLGLYFGNAHRWLFRKQFPRLKHEFFHAMVAASDKVDSNQRLKDSYMHYMRDPGSNDPQGKIYEFIRLNIRQINQLTKKEDFESLGRALHCLQDFTAIRHVVNSRLQVFPFDPSQTNIGISMIPIFGIPLQLCQDLALEHAWNDIKYFTANRKFIYSLYWTKWRYDLTILKLRHKSKLIEDVENKTQKGAGDNIWTGTKEEQEDTVLKDTTDGIHIEEK